MKHKKQRLDILLHERFPEYSRRQIQSWIMQGKVEVDDKKITKAGTSVSVDAKIALDIEEPKFVSRAGFKLEKALDEFNIDVKDLVALDAGISTGGFTDCLLQRGIGKVYGIDVGYGQVHEKVANNPRVQVMERTNLRTLDTVGQEVDIVTLDLSFISVLKVMDTIDKILKNNGRLVVLIKPQFEAQKKDVGRGGIIRDPDVHKRVIDNVVNGISQRGYAFKGITESPILGGSGNKEFLAYFVKQKK